MFLVLNQRLNPCTLHCKADSSPLDHQGSPPEPVLLTALQLLIQFMGLCICQWLLWQEKPWLHLMSSTVSKASALYKEKLNSCSTNTTKWRWEDRVGGSSSLEAPISVPISHQGNRRQPRSRLWGNSETMTVTHEELLIDTHHADIRHLPQHSRRA